MFVCELDIVHTADEQWMLAEHTAWAHSAVYNVGYYLLLHTLVGHVMPFCALCVCCAITVRMVRASYSLMSPPLQISEGSC
jgi:hypothetical protein